MPDIDDLRTKIDSLDDEILEILVQRFEIAEQIREVKSQNQQPALDKTRWQQIESRLRDKAAASGLNPEDTVEIFRQIHLYVLKNIYKEKV